MEQSFSEFLVEQGAISTEQGAGIVAWARQSRDLLGTIAMEHGLLSAEQIRLVLKHQRDAGGIFGDACIEMGYLDRIEVDVLLRAQELRTSRCEVERVMLGGLVRSEEIEKFLRGYYRFDERSHTAADAA